MVQRDKCSLYPDKIVIEDSLKNVKLDQLVGIKKLSILLFKSIFSVEVDNLLLGTIDVKTFHRSKVEFSNIADKVITNAQVEIEEDMQLLMRE